MNKQKFGKKWPTENKLILWETCVRQIIIGTQKIDLPHGNFHHYSSAKAYAFLLEVICGLHSPMIAETEIMAQFKSLFVGECHQLFQNHLNIQFHNCLLRDAKIIRSTFLKSYGEQSYGGIVKEYSKHLNAVHIIGNGHLASSILTHLSRDKRKINLQCRNLLKGERLKQKFPIINSVQLIGPSIMEEKSLLVIAAPIKSKWLESYIAENKNIHTIIDLRSKQNHLPVNKMMVTNYIDLDEVFELVKKRVGNINQKATLAKAEIRKRALRWQQKTQHRPYGWEELCVS